MTNGDSSRFVLSVIIPVRNQAGPLRRLLDKLERQQRPPGCEVEVLVVENGSTDATPAVIEASSAARVSCPEPGVAAARNAGVAAARGGVLYFIDADACPVHDDHYIRLVNTARRLGRFGAFGGAIQLPRRQRWNPVAVGDHWACWFNWHPRRKAQRSLLFQPTVSLVTTRRAFNAVAGFDRRVAVLEDMVFHRRLLGAGYPVYYVPWLQVTHEARGSLLRSWRHSWSWGAPFRERYLRNVKNYGLKYPPGSRRFWCNLPMLFRRRMRLVGRAAWANDGWRLLPGYPFLALTVFVWVLGVIWGSEPSPERGGSI